MHTRSQMLALLGALIVLLLVGCGQKGDLYLPDKTASSAATLSMQNLSQ